MKSLIFLCIICAALCTHVDVYEEVAKIVEGMDPEMVKNPIIMRNYLMCFLEKKRCNKVAASLKRLIEPSLDDACSRCTHSQKITAKKMYDELVEKYPEEYEEFKQKYDPSGHRITAIRNAITV